LSRRTARLALAGLLSLLLIAAPSAAAPIIDVLQGVDANYRFSVVHSSTGGSDGQAGSVLARILLGPAGGTATVVGPVLELDVQLVIAGDSYQATGAFDVAGLLDDVAQTDRMLGSLSLVGVGNFAGTYYFKDRNYSSAVDPPNSLHGTILTLWGATNVTNVATKGAPQIGDEIDLSPGGTGMDLRLEISSDPIPEPSSVALYALGLAAAGGAVRRTRRRT
jgi:hypothetical protein